MSTVVAPAADCANCGTPLDGPFCHACGQRAASPNISLHDFFHEAFHEFAHLDGKIVQTVRVLLTKPGELTSEFLAGRRQRFVSPLRLYLTCSLLFFALAAVAPVAARPYFTITKVDGEAGLPPERLVEVRREATVRANEALVHALPRVMFVLMPAFGLLTWLLYKKSRPFYAAHLYYAIHFHAYAFLVLTTALALRPIIGSTAGNALPLIAVAYCHFIGLRRVFGGSTVSMVWKGFIIWLVYLVMVGGTVLIVGIRLAKSVGG